MVLDDDENMYFPVPNLTKPELDKKGKVKATVNEQEIVLISRRGVLYAFNDKCPHRGGPLSMGDIEDVPGLGPCVKCPYHGWVFELVEGRCIEPGNRLETLATVYPVKVECPSHKILVGFKEIAPAIFTRIPS